MNILVSNDDGISSEGILELVKKLINKHNVLVVAPDGNRSGYSHSLSFYKNLSAQKVDLIDNVPAYSLSGTPADCVKFASHLFNEDFPIDLVIAGINKGNNLGTDVLYSGTVSAAVEGAMLGYKAMAFSSCAFYAENMEMCAEITADLVEKLFPLANNTFIWNINIPNLNRNEIKGVKITPLGEQLYSDNYKKINENEYVLVGKPIKNEKNPLDCDVEWSAKGYITATPILYNKTDYSTIKLMNEVNLDV